MTSPVLGAPENRAVSSTDRGLPPPFHLFWTGEGVSVLGNATTSVLLPLVAVIALDAGPTAMGLLAAATWLPWLVIGLPAGAWIDRRDPRAVMIGADLGAAVVIGSVPVAAWLGLLSVPHLLAVALANGVCTVFFRSAYPRMVKVVVPDPDDRKRAMGRLVATESAAHVAGPGVAALLIRIAGATGGLVVDAASFLVSALCLWRMPRSATEDGPAPAPLGARIAEGVRVTRTDAYLRFFAVIGALSNIGLTGLGAMLVLFLVRDLGLGGTGVGVVLAVSAVGGAVGAGVAPRLSARYGTARTLVCYQLLCGPAALLIALGGLAAPVVLSTLPVVLGQALVGFGVVGGNAIRGPFFQQWVPDHLLARVMTSNGVLIFGGMPLAGVLAGVLGSTMGIRETVIVMAAIHAGACLLVLRAPFRGLRDLPDGPMPSVGSMATHGERFDQAEAAQ